MIIVVEGCDNSGKTTLALEMAKHFKGIFIKTERVPPLAEDLSQYHRILEAAKRYGNGHVVSDRHAAISDPIYGPIVRGGTKLKDEDIYRCLQEIDAIVYCRPPDKMIVGRMAERDQMAGVLKNVMAIIEAYDRFFSGPSVRAQRVWRYDWTRDTTSELFAEIKRFA